MDPEPAILKFRVEPAPGRSFRHRLAMILVALVSVALRVKVRPVVDAHAASRWAEADGHRRMAYRGVVVGDSRGV